VDRVRGGRCGRDPQKGKATAQEIREATANEEVELLLTDLFLQVSTGNWRTDFWRARPAPRGGEMCGSFFPRSPRDDRRAGDGLRPESPRVLPVAALLIDLLEGSAPERIVNVTSGAQCMDPSTSKIFRASVGTEARWPTTSPSSPTCYSPTVWRAGSTARGERQLCASRCGGTNFGQQNQPLAWG
jgi:hypothetical protein